MEMIVRGGKRLSGEVRISGSKNGALPILFATLITKGVSRIENLPDIGDIRVAIRLLEGFGAKMLRSGVALYIDTEHLTYREPDPTLVSQIRASSYLIGACLARFGKFTLSNFGGCSFSNRPIDMHLYAAEALGARIENDVLLTDGLKGAEIVFDKPSVGATVNAIIMASLSDGETHIHTYAKEPHIFTLVEFLKSCGADIEINDGKITVIGRHLHGGDARICGDMIEAGTYLSMGVITSGKVTVKGVFCREMTTFIDFLRCFGAKITTLSDSVTVESCEEKLYTKVVAEPYPGFPTDMQPLCAPLMAFGRGGEIYDFVWRERFGYLAALSKFGVVSKRNGCGAVIYPSNLSYADVTAPDLRGAAACLLCALHACGESQIKSAEILLRGYEHPDEKLRSLGADVRILNN